VLSLKTFSQTRLGLITLVLFIIQQLSAGDLSIRQQPSPPGIAFGRYVASIERGSPFSEPGQFAVLIEASAPDLYKDFALIAIRQVGEDKQNEFLIAGMDGDGAVAQEVIARYFAIEEQLAALPRSSTQITPEHYKFHFRGHVKTGDGGAYVYDISPTKRRPGLFKGQIWIDAVGGAELLVSGRFTDFPSTGESVSFVRETKLDAAGYTRVSHVNFSVPLLGRSEVIVTERPLGQKLDVSRLAGELMHF
jgi:hypothetical protein